MKKLIVIISIFFFGGVGFSQNDPVPDTEEVFINSAFYPTYSGGEAKLLEFINSNLRYQESESLYGIYGVVYVEFYVEKNGNLSTFKVKRSPHEQLSTEALRVCNIIPEKW